MSQRKKVIFVQFSYRTENKVFIGAFADLLKERGVTALYVTDDEQAPVHWQATNLHFVVARNGHLISRDSRSIRISGVVQATNHISALRKRLYLIKRDIQDVIALVKKTRHAYSAISSQQEIVSIVGIEPQGGLAAGLIAWVLGKPFFYCSMELKFSPFRNWLTNKVFEILFKRILKSALIATVQDRDRAKVLQRYIGNRMSKEKICIMPVGTSESKRYEKTDYFHRKLGIESSRRIILYAGSIREWACVREIAASAHLWPQEYCLVIHGFIPNENDEYLRCVRQYVDKRKVYLSTEIVPWSELDSLLCSAHMSIAAYSDQAENTSYISASSNKLANYARCGLPLLISHSENVAQMFETVRWGVTFKQFEAIPQSLCAIEGDYSGYRSRCYDAFDRFYNLRSLGKSFTDTITGQMRPAECLNL